MDTNLSPLTSASAAKRPREPVEGTAAVAARREADEAGRFEARSDPTARSYRPQLYRHLCPW
eukprot:2689269-Prymnesium_polylepis.1